MSTAYRHALAERANMLLGYATRFWQRADRAECPHDRAYYERVGSRYFAQSCDLIDWADALAVNPSAAPKAGIASAFALSFPPPTPRRLAA